MNREEYLEDVVRILRSNFRSSDPTGAMTASRAGMIVQRFFGQPPTHYGFVKFIDVLQVLEQRGVIVLTKTSKDALALKLTNVSPNAERSDQVVVSTKAGDQEVPTDRFTRLRNSIWLAYVACFPKGLRFVNKFTGIVKMGLDSPPEPSHDWSEIIPFSPEEEKENAVQFVKSRAAGNEILLRSLSTYYWYREFPVALFQENPELLAKWNRERTRRAVERARALCEKTGIKSFFLFEENKLESVPSLKPGRKNLKEIILKALSEMKTEELLELKIPTKYLVSAMSPDLVSES